MASGRVPMNTAMRRMAERLGMAKKTAQFQHNYGCDVVPAKIKRGAA
jgi:hypothetical protein